jgi:hypothetical protein
MMFGFVLGIENTIQWDRRCVIKRNPIIETDLMAVLIKVNTRELAAISF